MAHPSDREVKVGAGVGATESSFVGLGGGGQLISILFDPSAKS